MKMERWGAVIVSTLVTTMFGLVVTIWVLKPPTVEIGEAFLILLGALASSFTTVVGYWVGSSAASKAKDSAIENLSKQP